MDVINLLKDDHDVMLRLLEEIEKTESAEERRSLFDQVARVLRRHSRIEEKIVYPELEQSAIGRNAVIEAHEVHLIVARLVREMKETPLTEERWTAKLNVLCDILARHLEEEHDTIFPKIRHRFDKQERARIGTDIALAYAPSRG